MFRLFDYLTIKLKIKVCGKCSIPFQKLRNIQRKRNNNTFFLHRIKISSICLVDLFFKRFRRKSEFITKLGF